MPRYIGAYRGGVRPSASTTVYRTCTLPLPCHSEPVTDVTGVGIRPPRLPLRGRCQRAALTEGLSKRIFRAPARGTFALGGKSTQKRRSNLRFENPFARLHTALISMVFTTRTLCRGNFTEMLHRHCFSFCCRFCSEMQSCAVLYLVCRGGVLRCGAKRNECPWGTPPAI